MDPPPISTTKKGPSVELRSWMAPANDNAASSSPLMTSGSIPRRSRTPSTNKWRLVASRVALVAQNLIFSTPRFAISAANLSTASKVRATASGWNCPVWSTPCPKRTISMSRTTSRKLLPSISAINRRIELVPQSIAATRMGCSSTIQATLPTLHHLVDSHLGLQQVSVQQVSAGI